jgi:hypothetical protein
MLRRCRIRALGEDKCANVIIDHFPDTSDIISAVSLNEYDISLMSDNSCLNLNAIPFAIYLSVTTIAGRLNMEKRVAGTCTIK